MSRSLTLVASAFVLWSTEAWATGVGDVPNPRDRGGWVTDAADVLAPEAEARLDALAEGLKTDIGVEVAVVTLQSVEGTPKEFATALFNHWGIGQAAHDNGLLVLLVMGERRLEMEVGVGLEDSLPDDWLGEMQGASMVPRFKQGDFGGGIVAGVEEVDARLRAGPGEVPVAPAPAPRPAPYVAPSTHTHTPPPEPPRTGPWAWVLGALGAVGVALGVLAGRIVDLLERISPRFARWWNKCPQCGGETWALGEQADDAHLDAGQIAEERVGSIDWQVRVCVECQHASIRRRVKWFSGYSSCPHCHRRTCKVKSRTITEATTTHGGRGEKTWNCQHCGYAHRTEWTTPRRTPASTSSGSTWNRSSSSSSSSSRSSSSSSRSSSSSFGGGRSRGGGKGSSW